MTRGDLVELTISYYYIFFFNFYMYSIQSYLWIRIGDDTETVIDNGKESKTIEWTGFSVARIIYACNRNVR